MWVGYLPAQAKHTALTEINITKDLFTKSLRASSTCPYIVSTPGSVGHPTLTEDGYYITPYQPGDSPEYHASIQSRRQRNMRRHMGWEDEHGNITEIEYKTNRNGFRDEHFSDQSGIACFGCSNTFGTGLNLDQTWPAWLQKMTGTKTWNLGTPALSLEIVTYYALNWLDEDLPNLEGIAVFAPPQGRTLRVNQTGSDWLRFSRMRDFVEREDTPIDLAENLLDAVIATSVVHDHLCIKALEFIAKAKNIPFALVKTDDIRPIDWARDMQHRGPDTMRNVAAFVKQQLLR